RPKTYKIHVREDWRGDHLIWGNSRKSVDCQNPSAVENNCHPRHHPRSANPLIQFSVSPGFSHGCNRTAAVHYDQRHVSKIAPMALTSCRFSSAFRTATRPLRSLRPGIVEQSRTSMPTSPKRLVTVEAVRSCGNSAN